MDENSEENEDTNIEQKAWDFVDLVFTGQNSTKNRTKILISLWGISNIMKSL